MGQVGNKVNFKPCRKTWVTGNQETSIPLFLLFLFNCFLQWPVKTLEAGWWTLKWLGQLVVLVGTKVDRLTSFCCQLDTNWQRIIFTQSVLNSDTPVPSMLSHSTISMPGGPFSTPVPSQSLILGWKQELPVWDGGAESCFSSYQYVSGLTSKMRKIHWFMIALLLTAEFSSIQIQKTLLSIAIITLKWKPFFAHTSSATLNKVVKLS